MLLLKLCPLHRMHRGHLAPLFLLAFPPILPSSSAYGNPGFSRKQKGEHLSSLHIVLVWENPKNDTPTATTQLITDSKRPSLYRRNVLFFAMPIFNLQERKTKQTVEAYVAVM